MESLRNTRISREGLKLAAFHAKSGKPSRRTGGRFRGEWVAAFTATAGRFGGDFAIRMLSIGVGIYPEPKRWGIPWLIRQLLPVKLLQKTLSINTASMEQLRTVLFRHIPTIRISETFERPEMATDLMEHRLEKLDMLFQCGRESYAKLEPEIKTFVLAHGVTNGNP